VTAIPFALHVKLAAEPSMFDPFLTKIALLLPKLVA
jgi:hypothetical protein